MRQRHLVLKSLLVLSLSCTLILASESNDSAEDTAVAKIAISPSMNKKETLAVLDSVLSPFEDMTEYALNNDLDGMKKSYKHIELIEDNTLLKQTITTDRLKELSADIETLETFIDSAQYSKVALLSSKIFNDIVSNFRFNSKIKEQLHIESLDYMGFMLLSILNNKTPNYIKISNVISNAKSDWNALKGKIQDENMKEAFDLLFQGLEYSCQAKDANMLTILAKMDLALVDVVEVIFQ